MKKILVTLGLSPLLCFGSSLPDTFKLSVGAFIVGDNKTLFSLSDHNGERATLDLQKRLAMKTDATSVTVNGYYRFNKHHRVEFGYGGVRSSSSKHYGEPLKAGNNVIDLSTGVETHLNISVLKLLYNYSFYHNDDVELGLAFGIHRTELDYELTAYLGENGKDKGFSIVIAPPIPVIGTRVHYNILKSLSVEYRIDLMSLSTKLNYYKAPNIKEVSGYIMDQNLNTEYQFIDNMSVGMGLNYNVMRVNFIKESYDIGLENDVLGVNLYAAMLF